MIRISKLVHNTAEIHIEEVSDHGWGSGVKPPIMCRQILAKCHRFLLS